MPTAQELYDQIVGGQQQQPQSPAEALYAQIVEQQQGMVQDPLQAMYQKAEPRVPPEYFFPQPQVPYHELPKFGIEQIERTRGTPTAQNILKQRRDSLKASLGTGYRDFTRYADQQIATDPHRNALVAQAAVGGAFDTATLGVGPLGRSLFRSMGVDIPDEEWIQYVKEYFKEKGTPLERGVLEVGQAVDEGVNLALGLAMLTTPAQLAKLSGAGAAAKTARAKKLVRLGRDAIKQGDGKKLAKAIGRLDREGVPWREVVKDAVRQQQGLPQGQPIGFMEQQAAQKIPYNRAVTAARQRHVSDRAIKEASDTATRKADIAIRRGKLGQPGRPLQEQVMAEATKTPPLRTAQEVVGAPQRGFGGRHGVPMGEPVVKPRVGPTPRTKIEGQRGLTRYGEGGPERIKWQTARSGEAPPVIGPAQAKPGAKPGIEKPWTKGTREEAAADWGKRVQQAERGAGVTPEKPPVKPKTLDQLKSGPVSDAEMGLAPDIPVEKSLYAGPGFELRKAQESLSSIRKAAKVKAKPAEAKKADKLDKILEDLVEPPEKPKYVTKQMARRPYPSKPMEPVVRERPVPRGGGKYSLLKHYTYQAQNFLKSLGPAGKQLAKEAFAVDAAHSQAHHVDSLAIHRILGGLKKSQVEMIAKVANKVEGLDLEKIPKWMQRKADDITAVLDNGRAGVNEANLVGVERILNDGTRIPTGPGGKPIPQVLNKKGRKMFEAIERGKKAHPDVHRAIRKIQERYPDMSEQDAFDMLKTVRDQTKARHNHYLQSERVELPSDLVEWDIRKFIDGNIEANANTIESVRMWGPRLKGATSKAAEIGEAHGKNVGGAITKWIEYNWGAGSEATVKSQQFWNAWNNLETIARMGLSLPSALLNMGQRFTAASRYPVTVLLKGLRDQPPFVSAFFRGYRKLAEKIQELGPVRARTALADYVQSGPWGEAAKTSMVPFSRVEKGNQVTMSIIGKYGLERDMVKYAQLADKSRFRRIVDGILSTGGDTKGAISRRLNRTGLTDWTPEEINHILKVQGGELTPDQIVMYMHRLVQDTQFPVTPLSQPVWWHNPGLRLGAKYKTFGVRQLGMVYKDVVREAIKGNFAPLRRFSMATMLVGETYNIIRDELFGKEESITKMVWGDPAKRNKQQVAWSMLKNMADGGGIGMLADLTYGITGWVGGPAVDTVRNAGLAMLDVIKEPSAKQMKTALRDFFESEVTTGRQVRAVMEKLDQQLVNENNRFFEYHKWRKRGRDFATLQKEGWGGKVKKAFLEAPLEGQEQFHRTEDTAYLDYAARQITAGDVDDATEYLVGVLENAKDKRAYGEAMDSIKRSRTRQSPMGPIPEQFRSEFKKQYPEKDWDAFEKLHKDWLRDYNKAIKAAYVRTKKKWK